MSSIKNFIKNEEKLISLLNELINSCGDTKELAKTLDNLVFEYMSYFLSSGECGGGDMAIQIYNVKGIRDFLFEIE